MEKKVIDLRDCKEDVEIIFPLTEGNLETKIDGQGHRLLFSPKKALSDLVPKSIEELEKKLEGRTYTNYRAYGWCVTEEDRTAIEALSELRRLWHEWTNILGTPCQREIYSNYIICYDEFDNEWSALGTDRIIGGALIFKEKSHAEKFIECFGELLEKAKILL